MPEISLHSVCQQRRIINMRPLLALVVFLFGLPALDHSYSSSALQESRTEPRPCDVNLLPAQVQNRIKADFSSSKLQESENLSQRARLSWTGNKASGYPGIAVGFFQSLKQDSFAALLVPFGHPDAAYRFVAYDPQLDSSTYEELIVDKSDDNGASNFFLQEVPVVKFFDETSKKKYRVQAVSAPANWCA
jgi:hypothetical protein